MENSGGGESRSFFRELTPGEIPIPVENRDEQSIDVPISEASPSKPLEFNASNPAGQPTLEGQASLRGVAAVEVPIAFDPVVAENFSVSELESALGDSIANNGSHD